MRGAGIARRCRTLLFVWWLGSSFPAVLAAAEFVELYKRGIAAIESNNWTLAAEMMQQAVAKQPQERARVKRGLYLRRYLPHFYLGQARFESGDCRGALVAWRESEAQGVVRRFSEYQSILEGRVACEQMVDLESALEKALQAVAAAESSGAWAGRQLAKLPAAERGAEVLRRRQAEAEATLRRTRQRLTMSDVVLEAVEEAAALAAVTKAEFEVIGQQAAELAVARVTNRRQELTSEIRTLVAAAREELAASDYLEPFPDSLNRRRLAVEQALQRAGSVDDATLGEGELELLRADLSDSVDRLRRAASPPPAVLVSAAEAFLSGDYAGVLARLQNAQLPSDKAVSYAHLLRAAALFSLYHASGQGDQELLERAAAEVVACGRKGAIRYPSASLFPPSFVEFFADRLPADTPPDSDSVTEQGR